MRYLLIAGLLVALILQIRFIYWMNEGVRETAIAAADTGPAVYPETGEVEIGVQLSARAKRLEAERGDPVWPLNPKQGQRVVRGFVYRGGEPVRGASIAIDQRPLVEGVRLNGYIGQPRWTDATGNDGYFEVNTLPEGSFILRAWDDAGMALAQVDLQAHTHAYEASLTLTPAQAMGGVVLVENAETGAAEPVREALVFPLTAMEGAGHGAALLAYIPTRTGRDGTFHFPHLRGLVRFAVQAANHDPWISPLVPAGSGSLRFLLTPGGAVTGFTQEQGTDSPLSGVEVTLTPKDLPLAALHVNSGEDGAFSFTGVPGGDYVLGVARGDYALARPGPELAVWPGTSFTAPPLKLVRAGAVEGRVLNEQGAPMEGVLIKARLGQETHEATSDSAGLYRLRSLPPGEYTLAAAPAGGTATPSAAPAIVETGQTGAGPEFTLAAGEDEGGLAVLVADELGKPIQGAAVHYRITFGEPGQSPLLRGAALTNGAGRVTIAGVPRGGYYGVYASAPGIVSAPTGWEPMAGAASADLTLTAHVPAACRAQGVVMRGGLVPAPGRKVLIMPAEGMEWPFRRAQFSDSEGGFDFAGLPPGTYRICAKGAPDSCIEVSLTPGAPATGLLLTVR